MLILGSVGALALLVATIYLVRKNWNKQLSSLKGEAITKKFLTHVVIDTASSAPVFSSPIDGNEKWHTRIGDYVRIFTEYLNQNVKQRPQGEAMGLFCQEMVQYKLLKDVNDLQRIEWAVGMVDSSTFAEISNRPELSEPMDMPGDRVVEKMSSNRFSRGKMAAFSWRRGFRLPANADFSIGHYPASETGQVERYSIEIYRPRFFHINIDITPLPDGESGIPRDLVLDPEVAKRLMTLPFAVNMTATFNRSTAGHRRTAEYRVWVKWLFAALELKNA